MMKIFGLIFLCVSCAGVLKRNVVTHSDIVFRGGTFHDQRWEEELVFRRVSWFDEITMLYDFAYARIDENNPFVSWLGKERLSIAECDQFYAVLIYTKRNSVANTSFLKDQFTRAGYDEMILVDFADEVRSHQGFKDWRLSQHKILGLCRRAEAKSPISLHLPGFDSVSVFDNKY